MATLAPAIVDARPLGRVEHIDDVSDPDGVAPQERECWFVSYPKGRLIEKYLRGDVAIAFRQSEPATGRHPVQNGLIVCASQAGFDAASGDVEIGSLYAGVDNDQSLMLAQNVHLVEGIQDRVATTVRLKRFDRGDFSGREPLFNFIAIHSVAKVREARTGLVNGEVSLAARFYAVARSQCRREQIKRTAGRVQDGTNLGTDEGIEGAALADCQHLISGISIRLYETLIRVTPLPGFKALLQHWDLGYGPID
jgi:hypothetical protein